MYKLKFVRINCILQTVEKLNNRKILYRITIFFNNKTTNTRIKKYHLAFFCVVFLLYSTIFRVYKIVHNLYLQIKKKLFVRLQYAIMIRGIPRNYTLFILEGTRVILPPSPEN